MNAHDVDQDGAEIKPGRKPSTPRPDPWYKRYPEDYRRGTRKLSLAARGAYSDILDMIYMAGGPIEDDDFAIACELRVKKRVWLRARAELFKTGKLVSNNGLISNPKADEVLAERSANKSASRTKSVKNNDGQKRLLRGKSNEINGGTHTEAEAELDTELDGVKGEVESSSSSVVNFAAAAARVELDILMQKLVDAGGEALAHPATSPNLMNLSIPRWWMEQGADLERDILPALRKIAGRRRHGRKILSWEYYNNLVAENRDARQRGLEAQHQPDQGRSSPAFYDPEVARRYKEQQAALLRRPMVRAVAS